ncbi:MAG TPA: nitrilase-related carbon-nitrogen hydrolase [Gaiellaceae bacterium]|nr:nitrilase-related carbon-nitrogen hydrolase [Gaiellaceae bacterium]
MRIALAQLVCRAGDPSANERALLEAAHDARHAGADLLVAPELQLAGYACDGDEAGRSVDDVAALLDGSGLAVVAGFAELGAGATYNSAAWIEDGGVLHVHRKLYLCDYPPFDEHVRFAAGEAMRSFDTAFGRAAILICNDAWQPFLPALAAHGGAELLLVPAASSTAVPEAEPYWRDLTRVYARLLQCYVAFVNQAGRDGGLTFWGGSHVVDPSGEIVSTAGAEAGLLVADVDLERVSTLRRRLPLLRDLRPGLLASELERFARTTRP